MLRQIRLRIKAENGERPSMYWGYLLYGILMEKLDAEFADYMHEQSLKPISQFIIRENSDSAVWKINMLDNVSSEVVIQSLEKCDELYSEKIGSGIIITDKEISEPINTVDFCKRFFIDQKPERNIEINFLTSCSFKSDENYCIFPSSELIIKSLVNKWNAFSDDFTLDDEDALEQLIGHTRISRYELRSSLFHIKGVKIPSFLGKVTLSVNGPEPLLRLFNLIMAFSEFSGIGIKTALGMGGCEVSI